MQHFPIFLAMADARVLLSGGEAAALAKLRLLLKTPARIEVYADPAAEEIRDWAAEGRLTLIPRPLTAEDIPGVNDVSPIMGDDPVFADGLVQYVGQSLFAVAADTIDQARAAANLAEVEYDELPALLTVDQVENFPFFATYNNGPDEIFRRIVLTGVLIFAVDVAHELLDFLAALSTRICFAPYVLSLIIRHPVKILEKRFDIPILWIDLLIHAKTPITP